MPSVELVISIIALLFGFFALAASIGEGDIFFINETNFFNGSGGGNGSNCNVTGSCPPIAYDAENETITGNWVFDGQIANKPSLYVNGPSVGGESNVAQFNSDGNCIAYLGKGAGFEGLFFCNPSGITFFVLNQTTIVGSILSATTHGVIAPIVELQSALFTPEFRTTASLSEHYNPVSFNGNFNITDLGYLQNQDNRGMRDQLNNSVFWDNESYVLPHQWHCRFRNFGSGAGSIVRGFNTDYVNNYDTDIIVDITFKSSITEPNEQDVAYAIFYSNSTPYAAEGVITYNHPEGEDGRGQQYHHLSAIVLRNDTYSLNSTVVQSGSVQLFQWCERETRERYA